MKAFGVLQKDGISFHTGSPLLVEFRLVLRHALLDLGGAGGVLIVSSSLKTIFEARVDDHQGNRDGQPEAERQIVRIVAGR